MSETKEARLARKHAFFRQDFDNIQSAVRETRLQCLSDRRFYSIPGAQWEGPVGVQFENKPRFEFNKTHLAVLRIINEYRNNRITVDFVPKDGGEDDDLADTCDGLFRADEQDSGAQEAYDNCFEEGSSGGMGAIRVRARYVDDEDDDDDRQRVAIEPIFEADTCVFFSLDGKRQDKADAKRCYVLTSMTPQDYADEYDDDPASWPKEIEFAEFDWNTPDVVWVAEVYEVEQKSELIHIFRGLALQDNEANEMKVTDAELTDEYAAELKARGFREVRQKRIKRTRIHKYIMSGNKVLEDCGYIAGTCIPVIPYYGKRWFVGGIERCQGHVRLARDAQVLDNMIKSWLAEMAARFDVEKPILSPEEIAGHAQMWAEDNIKKYPYLLKNNLLDAGGNPIVGAPMNYTRAPNLPPAMAALAQMAAQSLEDMLGNQQAGEQMQPNQSGKAVELIQQRLDMQVFIYMDNFKKAVKRLGEVWLSMMKDIAVEPGRKMKTVSKSGEPGAVELMRPTVNEAGEQVNENDLSKGKFDVAVDVGPSSISRDAAVVRAATGIAAVTQDPETQLVMTHLAINHIQAEGMREVKQWSRRKLVSMGVYQPTDEEKAELEAQQANAQPSAQDQYLMAAAQKQKADAANALKDGNLTDAKVAQTTADAISKLAAIEQGREAHAVDLAMRIEQHGTSQAQAAQQLAQPQAPQTPT
jgi:hypothetical protein